MSNHCEGCDGTNCEGCANAEQQQQEEMRKVREQADMIKNVIVVMSGKGGVGKSTVAVNLAVSLSLAGKDVGILDVDVHGPSVPKLLKIQDADIKSDGEKILPAEVGNLKVMSVGLVTADRDEAIIWRGPLKYNIIKQFIGDVRWGNLDYLIIDCPPGTGDEVLSVIQLLGTVRGAVVVTTPQDIATYDVKKSISFCRKLNVEVLGVVENMSGFVCPHCGEVTEIFKSGGGEQMAKEMGVKFLGKIPLDPDIASSSDDGTPYVFRFTKAPTAKIIEEVFKPILEL